MALDKVKPLKLESTDTGGDENDECPTSLNPREDFIELRGIVIDTNTITDETTIISREDDDMIFKDVNNPSGFTLTQLAAGGIGFDPNNMILETNGTLVYIDDGDIVLRST